MIMFRKLSVLTQRTSLLTVASQHRGPVLKWAVPRRQDVDTRLLVWAGGYVAVMAAAAREVVRCAEAGAWVDSRHDLVIMWPPV